MNRIIYRSGRYRLIRMDDTAHELVLSSQQAKVLFKLHTKLGYKGVWYVDEAL